MVQFTDGSGIRLIQYHIGSESDSSESDSFGISQVRYLIGLVNPIDTAKSELGGVIDMASVVDTCDVSFASVIDTNEKFLSGVIDTADAL